MTVDTMLYYPEHIARIKEFKELADCFNRELQPVWNAMDQIYRNQYLDTLDEFGCEMHENLLEIHANPIDELEDRIRRIKGYYTSNLPYTIKKMKEVLSAMCGNDGYDLIVDTKLKTVTVNIKLNSINLVNNVDELMRRMIPATMVLKVEVIYNIYARFRNMTHEAMGQYTHEELRSSKIFLQSYNMHCNLGRYTHSQLSVHTYGDLLTDHTISEGG